MITYLTGDATVPQTPSEGETAIICHIVNDVGVWGSGFVIALSKKWPWLKDHYEEDVKSGTLKLGWTTFEPIVYDPKLFVANMCAQVMTSKQRAQGPLVRYEHLRTCLTNVNKYATMIGASLHMPRIGCGIGGGKWEEVEKIINETCTVPVYVYDLPSQSDKFKGWDPFWDDK